MKPLLPTLLVLATLPALAAPPAGAKAQGGGFAYKDTKGDVSVRANKGSGAFEGSNIRFDISGSVVAGSRLQGLVINAARMTGVVEPDPARKGSRRLGDLKASGGVTMIRSITENGVARKTDIKSTSATYDAGANDSGTATLTGNVVIVDDLGPRNVNLLGNSGKATFSTAEQGNSALKNATMTGNVRIKVTEVQNGVPRLYNASGDQLTYVTAGATGGTITLSGDVKLDSPGEEGGNVEGVRRAVLSLNAAGELTRVQFFTDDPATKVRTVFRPKRSTPSKTPAKTPAKAPAKKGG